MSEPSEAPSPTSAGADPVATLLSLLDLSSSGARTTEDIFTGVSQYMPLGRVYGGQVLSQSIVAASRTSPPGRSVHSMHGYFLRPGDSAADITFSVDRIHDGRSFSTRRAQAFQEGVPIFSMIASFQDEDSGLEHATPMPGGLPAPEDVSSVDESESGAHPASRRMFADNPIDVRHIPSPIYLRVDGEHRPSQAVWFRTRHALPDDPDLHRAALAYMSDMTIQESVLRAHGIAWATPGLRVASLDHAMWWHRFARVDDWLLYTQESPSSRGGRGLATGRIYTADGMLVASVAQEIMMRVPGDHA